MEKIPFYIVTGWLGSGKTTLLKNFLTQYGNKIRMAVIQNEFAPTGVDGKELQNTGLPFRLLEINNGSVFCVCQLDNFKNTLEKLVNDYNPQVILLESSGLADPISIAEILEAPEITDKIALQQIYTVIDAAHFEKTFQMMTRFKHQVLVADKLIINKTDLPGTNPDKIKTILKKWNPFAEIITTEYCRVSLDDFLLTQEKDLKKIPHETSGGRPDMGISLLRLHQKISKDQLVNFIDRIKNNCLRIKGFVNTTNGNTIAVMNQSEFQSINHYDGRSELIVFSDKYNARELTKMYKSMADD